MHAPGLAIAASTSAQWPAAVRRASRRAAPLRSLLAEGRRTEGFGLVPPGWRHLPTRLRRTLFFVCACALGGVPRFLTERGERKWERD